MRTVPSPVPPVNGIRQRQALQPVQLLRVACEAGIEDLLRGYAVLAVTTGDDSDNDTRVYWLKADIGHTRHVISFELTEFTSNARYHLPADLGTCDCPDHSFREKRPGGCKHMVALRQALLQVTRPQEDPVVEAVAAEDDASEASP